MKKAAIAFVALPLLCMGAGYGAGLVLAPAAGDSHAAATPENPAHPASADKAEAPHDAKDEAKDADKHGAAEADGAAQDGAAHKSAEADEAGVHPVMDRYELSKDKTIVRVGQMTIPVQKTNSISYVVADFALKVKTYELAETYRRLEEGTRLRDSLLQAMNLAAESAVLRGVAIDSDALSQLLRDLISKDHSGVDDVMFVSLYKQDVARL